MGYSPLSNVTGSFLISPHGNMMRKFCKGESRKKRGFAARSPPPPPGRQKIFRLPADFSCKWGGMRYNIDRDPMDRYPERRGELHGQGEEQEKTAFSGHPRRRLSRYRGRFEPQRVLCDGSQLHRRLFEDVQKGDAAAAHLLQDPPDLRLKEDEHRQHAPLHHKAQ